MKPFTTNMALQNSLSPKNETTNEKSRELPKEIRDKIKLIEKVFK